jgi:alkylhydroperoxidase/carboxymuconolactone decarboxylase family protein YurZ
MSWTNEMDPYFAELWSNFETGLANRSILDPRTRLLVSIGECVVIGETEQVAQLVIAALALDVPVAHIHEVMLQACVYAGRPIVNRSLEVFAELVASSGKLDELLRSRLPAQGPNAERDLDQERLTWLVSDQDFPRREEFMRKYGWQGVSAMLSTQPAHKAEGVQWMDTLDEGFTKLWVDFIYAGMYWRRVLDDKTRTLCMVGECLALQSQPQTENHMRNALILGCTPAEVLEVVFQTTQYVGMPRSLWGREILRKILGETPTEAPRG